MKLVALLLVALASSAAAATVGIVATRGDGSDVKAYAGSRPPAGLTLPSFSLRSATGGRVSSGSLAGKAVLVTFLDSRCRASCPLIASAIARGVDRLSPSERRRIAPVAITTNPFTDTPRHVRAFLRRERALGKLDYLLGSIDELRPVWRRFAILASADTGRHDFHSAPVRIYDRTGRWVSTLYAGVDLAPASVAHDIRAAAR